MIKYDLLIRLYNKEIDSIKNLKTEMEAARASEDWTVWDSLNTQFGIETTQLRGDIEAEYFDVPFAATARQGVEKFWEKAFGR
jgi:hypothetical protein